VSAAGYLVRSLTDVPAGDAWLGEREREILAGVRAPARRRSWRLGRWAGKLAVSARLDVPPSDVEILAAPDGAPEAWSDAEHLPVELSLSHRAGLVLAAAGAPPGALGCDAEAIARRSTAFVRDAFADAERAQLDRYPPGSAADLCANAICVAKEAAIKMRRGGPQLDRRTAVVTLDPAAGVRWAPATVAWPDGPPAHGWWRRHGGHVLCVMAAEPLDPPQPLTDRLPV
jgi:phosphopantetheinyl transferase